MGALDAGSTFYSAFLGYTFCTWMLYFTGYSCFSCFSCLAVAYLTGVTLLSSAFCLSCSFLTFSSSLCLSCSCLCRSCCSLCFLSFSFWLLILLNLISTSSLTFSAFTNFWWMISLSLFSCSIWCFWLWWWLLFCWFCYWSRWSMLIVSRCFPWAGLGSRYFVVGEVQLAELFGVFAQLLLDCLQFFLDIGHQNYNTVNGECTRWIPYTLEFDLSLLLLLKWWYAYQWIQSTWYLMLPTVCDPLNRLTW